MSQENSTEAGSTLLDIAALSGAQLDSPRGVPDDWIRDGTGLGTPQLLSAGSPAAPMLALVDTDPTNTGGWLARGRNVVQVEPGTALRIDCEEFYSIGRGGEFTESYLNLRAEHYTLVVHAVDEFGRETGSGVRLPITIVPPLTQTLWFRGLGAGALLLALVGAVRYATWRKVQPQMARLERQRAVEVERTRIARDLHDEMGARLTQISLLSARAIEASATPHAANEPLAKVQRAAHALASTLDEIVWATSPQHDTVAAFADHLSNYAAECASGEQALVDIPASGAKIAVLDIHLPGMQGIECISRLKARLPQLQVLVLTSYEDGDTIFRALKAGAGGYLVKRDASAMLLEALTEIMAGGAPMSCQIARKVAHFFHQRAPTAETEKLSAREIQILDLLVAGCILKEVADQLGIGRETVRTHVRHIYEKLHARSAAEAVAKYLSR